MKNLLITLAVTAAAIIGSVSANKKNAVYDFYVLGMDGDYHLISYLDYDFNHCSAAPEGICAYYHFRNNGSLPNTLTLQQVDVLSNYEPKSLKPRLDIAGDPISGHYIDY